MSSPSFSRSSDTWPGWQVRVASGDKDSWNQLEAALRHKFLPALTGRQAFSDVERGVLSLPVKLGGIGDSQ